MWVSKERPSSKKLSLKETWNCRNMVTISQDGVAAMQPNAQEGCTCGWFVSWLWCVEGFFLDILQSFWTQQQRQERHNGACIYLCLRRALLLLCQPPLVYEVLLMAETIRPAEGRVCCLLLFAALHLNLQLMVQINRPRWEAFCGRTWASL